MLNIQKLTYTWIAFHGITDLILPIHYWLPVYILSPISIIIPIKLLNSITFILSGIHFSYDCLIDIRYIYIILYFLLYYGYTKISQYFILIYMSLIHVPIHFSKIEMTLLAYYLIPVTFIIFYNFDILHYLLNDIVKSGGRSLNNNYHKLLLGIINSHIIVNLF